MTTTALPHAAIALTLSALAFAPGCSFISPVTFTSTKNVATPAPAVGGIDAETCNGSITIAAGGGAQVSVVATVHAATQERADATVVNVTPQPDGSYSVRVAWPGGKPQNNDGCSLEITVPGAKSVHAVASNGSVTIRGLSGNADLETSNGSINVHGHDGPVKAHTSNGAIRAEDFVSADLETSNGSIHVRPAGAGPVKAHTSNGGITFAVGSAFRGKLTASTSNAGVRNSSGLGKAVGAASKSSATFDFGEGEPSDISTSNGGITIEAAVSK